MTGPGFPTMHHDMIILKLYTYLKPAPVEEETKNNSYTNEGWEVAIVQQQSPLEEYEDDDEMKKSGFATRITWIPSMRL